MNFKFKTLFIIIGIALLGFTGCGTNNNPEDLKEVKELKLELFRRYKKNEFDKCISITEEIIEKDNIIDLSVKLIRTDCYYKLNQISEAKNELSYLEDHQKAITLKSEDFIKSLIENNEGTIERKNYGFDPSNTLTRLGLTYSYFLLHHIYLKEKDTLEACNNITNAINEMGNYLGQNHLPNDYPFSLQLFGVDYIELQKIRFTTCKSAPNYYNLNLDKAHITHYNKDFENRKLWIDLAYQSKNGKRLDYTISYPDSNVLYSPILDRRIYLSNKQMAIFRWSYEISKHDFKMAHIIKLYQEISEIVIQNEEHYALKLGYETYIRNMIIDFNSVEQKMKYKK
jgi:hypothetical protein